MTNTLPEELHGRIQRGEWGPDHPLKILGTDPLQKQLDPSGPTASRGRSVRPSVK